MNRRSLVLGVAVGAALVFAGATYLAENARQAEGNVGVAKNTPLERPYSPSFGPADAPVTIVEFFDPACEACRAFHPIVKQVLAKYPKDVRVVLRYTAFHPSSNEAIKILEASRRQGIFEPVLEALYKAQPRWAPHGRVPTDVWKVAARAGLDIDRARTDSKNPEVVAVMNRDAADVVAVGVRRTPTIFVNGKPLTRFGRQQFLDLVEQEVSTARSE